MTDDEAEGYLLQGFAVNFRGECPGLESGRQAHSKYPGRIMPACTIAGF